MEVSKEEVMMHLAGELQAGRISQGAYDWAMAELALAETFGDEAN